MVDTQNVTDLIVAERQMSPDAILLPSVNYALKQQVANLNFTKFVIKSREITLSNGGPNRVSGATTKASFSYRVI